MKLKTIFFDYFLFLFFVAVMLSCGKKTEFLLHESSLTIEESPWGVEFNAFPPHLNKFSYELSTVTEEKIDMLINKTSNLGVKWVRLSVDWQNVVDTLGGYHWKQLDRIIEGLSDKKIEIVLCINGGHKLYTKGNAPATLPEIILWKEFASNLVKRYKDRVKSWELWNEPNTVWFWKPKPVAQQYVTLMGEFYSLLKEIDPTAKIAGGAIARLDILYTDSIFNLGIGQYIDAFTFHPYNEFPEANIKPIKVSVKTPLWYVETDHPIEELKEIIRKANPTIEIWQGECGYPSEDNSSGWMGNGPWSPLIQAKWLLRRMFTDLSYGADKIGYFCLTEYYAGGNIDIGTGILNSKGLLTIDSCIEKPAWHAYRNLNSLINGTLEAHISDDYLPEIHKFGSFHNIKPKNIQFIEIQNKKNARFIAYWIVWRMQDIVENAEITLQTQKPFKKPVLVNLMNGEVNEIKVKMQGKYQFLLQLPLADYPFIITERSTLNKTSTL